MSRCPRRLTATLSQPVSQNKPICQNPAPRSRIVGVTSNEPEDNLGDGDASPDIRVTGDLTLELRAERSGLGNGRIYTVTVESTDQSGNRSTTQVLVKVPHDRGKSPK